MFELSQKQADWLVSEHKRMDGIKVENGGLRALARQEAIMMLLKLGGYRFDKVAIKNNA